MSMTNEQIALLALRWAYADAEAKMRKRERAYAMVLAQKAGAKFAFNPVQDMHTWNWHDMTSEQRNAVSRACKAHDDFRKASAIAGGRRAALTRASKWLIGTPPANASVMSAYDALCASENAENERAASDWA